MMIIDFTHSLDACFEWLVPKVVCTIKWIELKSGDLGHRARIMRLEMYTEPQIEYEGFDRETPALALCKAIEKLIDEEAKHE